MWPAANATTLVRTLVTNKAALARAADGILTTREQTDVRRPPTPTENLEILDSPLPLPAWEVRRGAQRKTRRRDPWTAADVALLDEATAIISAEVRKYGHIVVDEAQDLSPMQLRMIARRSPAGSVTLLGDLAQASGAWAPHEWTEVVEHLDTPAGWRPAELRLGYRSPADVIELAARIQRVAAPNVPETEAVRARRGGVQLVNALENVTRAVVAAVRRLTADHGSTAVIGVVAQLPELEAALAQDGIDAGQAELGGLERRVALVEARMAKGLEFDAVIVVDPAAIVASAADEMRGLRLLYVTVTRPTQALVIVHRGDLPSALLPDADGDR
jgi:DNA helicase IV